MTRAGTRIDYDVLVIASGTHSRPSIDGAVMIDDRNLGGTLRGLVQDVEEGYVQEIAFVAPPQAGWPLPLYELALMTAHRAYDMNVEVDISIVTPEGAPLAMFGPAISDELARRLRDAGIAFHGSSLCRVRPWRAEAAARWCPVAARPRRRAPVPRRSRAARHRVRCPWLHPRQRARRGARSARRVRRRRRDVVPDQARRDRRPAGRCRRGDHRRARGPGRACPRRCARCCAACC